MSYFWSENKQRTTVLAINHKWFSNLPGRLFVHTEYQMKLAICWFSRLLLDRNKYDYVPNQENCLLNHLQWKFQFDASPKKIFRPTKNIQRKWMNEREKNEWTRKKICSNVIDRDEKQVFIETKQAKSEGKSVLNTFTQLE